MFTVSAYLAGRTFLLFGGHVGVQGPSAFPGVIGPFAAAAAVHVTVNFALLRAVFWLTREPGTALGRLGLDTKLWLTDLGYGAFGLLIAAVWSVLGPFTPFLVLIPVFVARWAVAQFAAQQRAYEATVSALCQAVETKDFYTRGHSERVSRGSVMIATEIGMRAERVAAIRYAGMLHDVGKLGVPTSVLQKRSSLTDEEYAAIQLHPMRGLDIVREIGFLDEALAGIMHHHERIDGKGYRMGLAGDEIPEFARVLAVADAFDAMTSDRSYRGARPVPEAVAELRKWAGKQFDPAFVDAFVTAIERDSWTAPDPRRPRTRCSPPGCGRCAPRAPQGRPRERPADRICRPSRVCDAMLARRYEPRGARASAPDSGRWLLVVFAGLLLVWSVAQTAVSGVHDVHAALAFGALIALGELLRLNLPGDREAAPWRPPGRWPTRCCCASGTPPPGTAPSRSSR